MKKLIILLMIMAMASFAFAQVDTDLDMMGMYFDVDADMPCLDGVDPYTTQVIFIMITNPSFELLFGWEAGYDLLGSAQVLSTELPPDQLPLDVGGSPGNHIVGFGEPMIMGPVNTVAVISVLYMDTELGPLDFMLHGADPGSLPGDLPVVLLADGVLMTLGLSAADGLVAQINGGCQVVSTENLSFEGIKSLYR